MSLDDEIEALILELCRKRGADKTICPSEVARALQQHEADWRSLMPAIRNVTGKLVRHGTIRATQRGRSIDPEAAAGPIRLGINSD